MDKIDRNILKALQSDCRQPIAEIAQTVGLSLSACARRIGILEEKGMIEAYCAQLNGEALGFKITFFVEITLDSQSEEVLNTFEAAAIASPEVLECHLMTGSADYLIKVASFDAVDYEVVYRKTLASLPHVSRIQSSLVMKTVKPWAGFPTDKSV